MPIEEPGGVVWLRRHWDDLRSVNFQWIAATGDGLVANSPDLQVVIDNVVAGDLLERAVFAFVDFPEVQE